MRLENSNVMQKQVYYKDYLALETLLNAQKCESEGKAHDEMLFIVIHQTYELWFKQLLYEIDSVIAVLGQGAINDNSPAMQTVVHRLRRCVTILKTLVQQIDVMETMTAMDFLEFRDLLRPASGFQSYQFKMIEAKLGLLFEDRHGQGYYTSQLKPEDVNTIKNTEANQSILQLVNAWLERMPFNSNANDWDEFSQVYKKQLSEQEKGNADVFDEVLFGTERHGQLSAKASRAALFILLYRGYPMLELPYQMIDTLLEIDNQLAAWRSRHMNMVKRIIGTRVGTGGSTGAGYLKGALDKHYIFKELAMLTSFLVERNKLPQLSEETIKKLGYM